MINSHFAALGVWLTTGLLPSRGAHGAAVFDGRPDLAQPISSYALLWLWLVTDPGGVLGTGADGSRWGWAVYFMATLGQGNLKSALGPLVSSG